MDGNGVIVTVLTPAASYDLTTLAAVQDDLGIIAPTSSTLTFLARLITRASATIRQYCNTTFQAEIIKEEIYPLKQDWSGVAVGGMSLIRLSRWPVVSIASITEGFAPNITTLVSAVDYRLVPDMGHLFRLDSMTYPDRWRVLPVVVTYTSGYSAVPADVEDACSRLVKMRYLARTRDPALRQEDVPGVYSAAYQISSSGLPADVTDMLDRYRVPVIA